MCKQDQFIINGVLRTPVLRVFLKTPVLDIIALRLSFSRISDSRAKNM